MPQQVALRGVTPEEADAWLAGRGPDLEPAQLISIRLEQGVLSGRTGAGDELRDESLAGILLPFLDSAGRAIWIEVSAVSHEGLRELGFALARIVAEERAKAPGLEAAPIVIRPRAVNDSGFTVTHVRDGAEDYFQVRGVKVERSGREVARLGPGEFFGELALLSGNPRNATIVATDPLETYVLGEADFRAAMENSESFRDQLRQVYFLRH